MDLYGEEGFTHELQAAEVGKPLVSGFFSQASLYLSLAPRLAFVRVRDEYLCLAGRARTDRTAPICGLSLNPPRCCCYEYYYLTVNLRHVTSHQEPT